jgi:hypothetical protein
MSPGAVGQAEPIHFAAREGYDAATACGKTTQPKPATDEWENVTCSHCFSIGLLKTAWAAADRFESRVWFAGRLFDIKIEVEGLPRLGFDGPIDRSSTHVCHLSVKEPSTVLENGVSVRTGIELHDSRRAGEKWSPPPSTRALARKDRP